MRICQLQQWNITLPHGGSSVANVTEPMLCQLVWAWLPVRPKGSKIIIMVYTIRFVPVQKSGLEKDIFIFSLVHEMSTVYGKNGQPKSHDMLCHTYGWTVISHLKLFEKQQKQHMSNPQWTGKWINNTVISPVENPNVVQNIFKQFF